MKRLNSMFDIKRMERMAKKKLGNIQSNDIKYNNSFLENIKKMRNEELLKEQNRFEIEKLKEQKDYLKNSPIYKYIN
jgi:hypothetical protein